MPRRCWCWWIFEHVFGWWMDFPQMAPPLANQLEDLTLRVSMIDTLGHLSLVIPKVPWIRTFLGTFLSFLDPKICSKRPKDQFLTNADALLLGFEQLLVGHWIGGKYMWGQVPPTFVLTALDQIPQTLWQIWCLFFCPGLHLLRFLDTDTARKKNNTTDYQKTWRVCVCDDSVIFSSMFCEKQKGCSEKKHVALSYDANPDGYEKSWCAAKAWTHRFPFVPAGNECKQLWIPL